jgi:hypothetical protein
MESARIYCAVVVLRATAVRPDGRTCRDAKLLIEWGVRSGANGRVNDESDSFL